jgi:SsrA-binding protein
MGKSGSKTTSDKNVYAINRKARHNFSILKTLECGLVLNGSEAKAVKTGKADLSECYVRIIDGELWCVGLNIGQYAFSQQEHEPLRNKKLLLHRKELFGLQKSLEERGLTLLALKLYLRNGVIKCEIGLAKGKKQHDKREAEKKRVAQREVDKFIKNRLNK